MIPTPHPETGRIHFAFDKTTSRLGCVLIQAALGASPGVRDAIGMLKTWQVDMSPSMKLWSCTPAEWPAVVALHEDPPVKTL